MKHLLFTFEVYLCSLNVYLYIFLHVSTMIYDKNLRLDGLLYFALPKICLEKFSVYPLDNIIGSM